MEVTPENSKLLAGAELRIMYEFRKFAKTIIEPDFFDPRNRDVCLDAFADFLAKRKVEFASND